MTVRRTILSSPIGGLIAGLLSATFLWFIIDGPYVASAQESKRSQEGAQTSAHAKLVARGRYIVEGVAGCGYCHTPRDENGDIDRSKWLAGAPVFYQPAQRVPGWPTTAPRISGSPPGSDAEMITLLTTSVSRNGRPLRSPMPSFKMTRPDAEAVVAYLKSLNLGH
jgi:mono/diheme cytochrome c family protein